MAASLSTRAGSGTQVKAKKQSFVWLWFYEVIAITAALFFLIALCTVLSRYDGHPVFSWRNITLNTIASILSKALTLALMLAVTESLGQWKWILFSNGKKPLLDFEKLDSASHSQWGSLKLFTSPRRNLLWRVGALASLLTIPLDPFTQQLIQLEQRLIARADLHTILPVAHRYSKGNERRTSDVVGFNPGGLTTTEGTQAIVFAEADISMQSAFFSGLTEPMDTISQQLRFQCNTGNCTWSSFKSLAVCSTCNDVSSQLRSYQAEGEQELGAAVMSPNTTNKSLPNGATINNWDGVCVDGTENDISSNALVVMLMNSFGTGNASMTNSFQSVDTLIWAMSILRLNPNDTQIPWPKTPVQALECGLFYCVKQYDSSVANGVLSEKEFVLTDEKRSPVSWQQLVPGWADGILSDAQLNSLEFNDITSDIEKTDLMLGQGFNVSQNAVDGISTFVQQQLSTEKLNLTAHSASNGYLRKVMGSRAGDGMEYEPNSMVSLFASTNLDETFEVIARSMSNVLREGADNSTVITGTSATRATYYRIIWPWISLHVLVMLLGSIFFGFTVWKSARKDMHVWKTNSLATLAAGSKVVDLLDGKMTIKEMEERAEHESVLLLSRGQSCKDAERSPLQSIPTIES